MDEILDQLLKSSYQKYQEYQTSSIKGLEVTKSIFDIFFGKCLEYHNGSVHNFQEMKEKRSTKSKGDLFELFCARYLKSMKNYDQVWLLKELSDQLKTQLKLPLGLKDYGIDLVCLKKGQYSAVQCKFKAPGQKRLVKNSYGELKTIYPCVNWKELTTFNELCNASGPWEKRITMTTAPSVRRMGGLKDPRDQSVCIGSFHGLNADNWLKLYDRHNAIAVVIPKIPIRLKNAETKKEDSEVVETKVVEQPLTKEEVRAKRLLFFSRQQESKI